LIVAEPDPDMRARLARRLGRKAENRNIAVKMAEASAGRLPYEDARFDAVVVTLVLCSVEDVAQSLAEVRRVLKPGGRLAFLEHVASDDPWHLRWQRRIEPAWKRFGGNCHLTRDTESAIRDAGFTIERIDRHVERRRFLLVRKTVRGIARAPG